MLIAKKLKIYFSPSTYNAVLKKTQTLDLAFRISAVHQPVYFYLYFNTVAHNVYCSNLILPQPGCLFNIKLVENISIFVYLRFVYCVK